MVYRVSRNANRRDYTLERQVGILIMNLMYYINETEFLEKSFFLRFFVQCREFFFATT